ncbi:2Fe-2S iron-sulfur cluster-binding protein [Leptothoe sp. PORK10 BA2]|uniref:2Fe-2S iron-sulfur cluster-binding protein n=1 Tax=Leptothoe sp. PORK10 BA2 TaxID=3110254 RepID=UPI002B218CC6|nr:2Fe-2S iron-sulfur cluster-binding protein [Leptothoe sp. PORK10 BA2]MEA5463641.1 2Fe-2S iron-sulfur cluster-binding protein [Leptothoe sp. PORK10 BA2]
MSCQISFPNSAYDPLTLDLHTPLANELTVQNSPILFGCRTGICGTCLVTITGDIAPPNTEERELLDILAPDCLNARLACQIDLTHDLEICPYEIKM